MAAIRVELQLADGTFTTGMLRAGQTIAQFNAQLIKTNPALAQLAANNANLINSITKADGASKGFIATLRDLSIVTGVVSMGLGAAGEVTNGWIGDIVRINAEMQRLNIQMRSLSRSSDPIKEAGDNITYLRTMATQAPFSLQTLANAFVKLKSTGVDPMGGSLQSLVDGVAAFGGSTDEFNRTVLAISQVSGKGVLQMEELRQQLGETMPRAVELMARSMGVGMAELIKSISTGTVQAKPALQAFYDELDRTYGGRAKTMMQTFDGQLKQTSTQLQTLALTVGGLKTDGTYGPNSFFGSITSQLGDLNTLLKSTTASNFATSLGGGLTGMLQILRATITELFNFRREILTVAEIAGTAFAFNAGIAGLRQLSGAIQGTVLSLQQASIQFKAAGSWLSLGASGMTSLSTAGIGAQSMLVGLRGGLVATGTAVSAMLPWIAILGTAVYAASEYFDIFGQKAQKAYDDLKQFGAATREEAEQIIASQQAQLQTRLKALDMSRNDYNSEGYESRKKEILDAIKDLESSKAQLIGDAERNQDQKAMERFQQSIDEQRAARQADYDKRETQLQAQYDAERQLAAKNGDSQAAVEDARHKALYASELKLYEDRIAVAQKGLDRLGWIQIGANEDQKRQYKQQQDYLYGVLAQGMDDRQRLVSTGGQFGVPTGIKITSDAAKVKKGQSELESLEKTVEDLTAKFNESSGAVASMQQAIANGDYGSVKEGGEAVQELHDKLLAATEQKAALDELMKGQSQAEQAVNQARSDALGRLAKAEEDLTNQKMTDADKVRFKLNNGFFVGLGPTDKIQESIGKIIKSFDITGDAVNQLGKALQDDAFGDNTVNHIKAVAAAIDELRGKLTATGSSLGGVDFTAFGSGLAGSITNAMKPVLNTLPGELSGRMSQMMQMLQAKGWSPTVAAGITGNLAGESGLDPHSYNPDDNGSPSAGIANWHLDRLDGLKAFAASQNKAFTDLSVQVDYLDKEMRGKYAGVASAMNMATSPQAAADMFMRGFERPSASAAASSSPYRQGYAMQAAGMGGGLAWANAAPAANTSSQYLPEAEKYNTLIENRIALTKSYNDQLDETAAMDKKAQSLEEQVARINALKDLKAQLNSVGSETDDVGKHFKKLSNDIQLGKLGPDLDVQSKTYADLVKAAKELDDKEASIAKSKSAQTSAATNLNSLEERRAQLVRQAADAHAKMLDPNMVGESSALQSLTTELNKYVATVGDAYTKDSQEYRDALQFKSNMLQSQSALDAQTVFASMTQETRTIQQGLMTQTQQRTYAMNQALMLIDNEVAKAKAAGLDSVEITKAAEAQKAAIRQQYAEQTNPLIGQMRQWGDLQGNLIKQSTTWMDGLAGGISDLIMGTNNLSSVINSMIKDSVNMLVKFAISGGGKGGSQTASTIGSLFSKGTGAAGGASKKASFGTAHTGGIIGMSSLRMKTATMSAFAGAPRFHTGGIVGDEVPIIAKKGEGVFTPEQMKHLGGFNQSMQINAPINIAGSAGTPEQNQDLANKMQKGLEGTLRAIAQDEILKSMRPGNIGNTRSRP